ncbi:MAG TPA: TlyA family RNA methyltransferase [Candidatus Limnocylindria bacterium]|jgi:23S rRNA (cytidine1920-2'-O)/16S rRNA (cytidine1409-2'-O)-methyltransferase
MPRLRLDQVLVERGIAPSRAAAQAMLLAGEVEIPGRGRALKAGNLVESDVELHVRERPRWASRAGEKLAAALGAFGVDPAGAVALDAGASTGGFTDVLLERGAARVYAVDVGRGQLLDRLARDPRVVSMERTNLRTLTALPESIQLATLDLSFISLRLVLPAVRGLLAPDGQVVALVKPQFEAGKDAVPRGGVIRDAAVHGAVLERFAGAGAAAGFGVAGLMRSPIVGGDGNVEFLAHLVAPPGIAPEALAEQIRVLTAPSG